MHSVRRALPLALLIPAGLSLGACGTFPTAHFDASSRLSERECLARVMYFESNRSSDDGMLAVGTVVMNRVQDPRYPKSVCGVVGQKNQFAEGALTKPVVPRLMARAERVADEVLAGQRHNKVAAAKHFHTAGMTFPYRNMHYLVLAGGNAFYEKRTPGTFKPSTPAERGIFTTQFASAARPARAEPIVVAEAAPALAFRPRPVVLAQASDDETFTASSLRATERPLRIAAVLPPHQTQRPAAHLSSGEARPSSAPAIRAASSPVPPRNASATPARLAANPPLVAHAVSRVSIVAKSGPASPLPPRSAASPSGGGTSVVAKSPPTTHVAGAPHAGIPASSGAAGSKGLTARSKRIVVAMIGERKGPLPPARVTERGEPETRRR